MAKNKSTNKASLAQALPDEVLLHVFSFLAPREIARTAKVCKQWRTVANDHTLWKQYLNPNEDIENIKNFAQHARENIVHKEKLEQARDFCLSQEQKSNLVALDPNIHMINFVFLMGSYYTGIFYDEFNDMVFPSSKQAFGFIFTAMIQDASSPDLEYIRSLNAKIVIFSGEENDLTVAMENLKGIDKRDIFCLVKSEDPVKSSAIKSKAMALKVAHDFLPLEREYQSWPKFVKQLLLEVACQQVLELNLLPAPLKKPIKKSRCSLM